MNDLTVVYRAMYGEQQSIINRPKDGLNWTPLYVRAHRNMKI